MAYYWFSTYTGTRWTPDKGYNETFQNQVVLIRNWFHLQKDGIGREKGTGFWQKYKLRGKTVYITVDNFSWDGYTQGYEYFSNQTPVFSLTYRISEKPGGKKVILNDTLTIKFPERYPASPPAFFSKRQRGSHIGTHGWLCILGHGKDWNSTDDTIISGINAAFDLIVYNTKRRSQYYY